MARARSGWTVRAHLLIIVACVVVVVVGVGAYLARDSVRTAEDNIRLNATFLAGVAADAMARNVATAGAQVTGLAANPALVAIIADPSQCQLSFGLDLFPEGRLEMFDSDGRVVCSSAAVTDAQASRRGVPWDRASPDAPSAPFMDAVTGEVAVALAAPVTDADGAIVGGVAAVLPMGGAAHQLSQTYGGPRGGYEFAIIDESLEAPLSGSTPRGLRGSQPVPGTEWEASATIDRGVALAPTRSVLARGAALGGAILVVLLAALFVVNRRIVRPLRHLTGAVGDAGPHVSQLLHAVTGPREIVGLAEAFRAALEAHEAYELQLSHQALHDPLTGLPNRALLNEQLTLSLQRALRSDRAVAVLFLDLDRFKLVNDSLGHVAGDQLLQVTAQRLAEVLRPGDTLARFGGDEFVIVADGCASAEEAHTIADRLLRAVEAPAEVADSIVRMTASVGIALGRPGSRGDDLIRDADNAMYRSKERGSARAELFDEELRDRVTKRRTTEHELRVALEREQLRVVYQPKIDLLTGETLGVEALLRWDHPALGAVPPATFIPIAEETGLMVRVGRFVLDQACRQLARWTSEGLDLTVAVNVSGRQLADAGFPEEVAAVLAATGVHAGRLCLELTESLLMTDSIGIEQALRTFHELGVVLSIDDFGTGYSSLAYLHRFPIDELKIDRTFIKDLTEHTGQGSLVSAMVAMGKSLGLKVVAEGVETAEQASHLRMLGCDMAQGYLFARPQRPERLHAALVREHQLRR